MAFTVEAVGPARYRLTGELDIASAARLERAVDRTSPADDALVLDVSELRFMDSSGLKALIRLARARAGGVMVLNPQPPVRRALWLTGFGDRPTLGLRIVEEGGPDGSASARNSRGSDFFEPD